VVGAEVNVDGDLDDEIEMEETEEAEDPDDVGNLDVVDDRMTWMGWM